LHDRSVRAETNAKNTAALAALCRCGAELRDDGTRVRAEIVLGHNAASTGLRRVSEEGSADIRDS
jgi:hypothetical protein